MAKLQAGFPRLGKFAGSFPRFGRKRFEKFQALEKMMVAVSKVWKK
ncbi:MAG: hypothetical protein NTY53_01995 [Kiritimatiellaeota bacterium]|nr:hypothetical protein [Kiritimatiellota bacterium]